MGTEKSIEQTTAEREAYDRDPAGYLASHEMTHGLKIHIMCGEAKLTHAAEKAHLEAERDAWREMARAERHAAGARLHGSGEQQAEAFRRLGAAEGALRDLGIDPHA